MLVVAVLVILSGYLLGGIPTGVILGRWLRGVDIRQHGSGGTGATNAARTLGWRISAFVFIFDVLKGVIAVLTARLLLNDSVVESLAGAAAIAGHCWSPYIRLSGGRGVATGVGGTLAVMPLALLLMLPVAAITVKLTRYISLASLIGSAMVPLAMVVATLLNFLAPGYLLFGFIGATIIYIQHRGNIRRLMKGTERRVGERVAVTGTAPTAQ